MLASALLLACDSRDSGNSEQAVPRSALMDCLSAVQSISHGLVAEKDAFSTYAHECSALYREPSCHAAVVLLPYLEPRRRLGVLIADCSAAYCHSLPGRPLPRACYVSVSDLGEDLAPSWQQLDEQILAFELRLPITSEPIGVLAGIMFNHL